MTKQGVTWILGLSILAATVAMADEQTVQSTTVVTQTTPVFQSVDQIKMDEALPQTVAPSTVPVVANESATKAVEQKTFQEPITIKPAVDLGWGYEDGHFASVAPGVTFNLNTTTASKRGIKLEVSYQFTLKEFLGEDAYSQEVESSSDLRQFEHNGTLKFNADITDKVGAEFKSAFAYSMPNVYEQSSTTSYGLTLRPAVNLKFFPLTAFNLAYQLAATEYPSVDAGLDVGTGSLDTDSVISNIGDRSVYPTATYYDDYDGTGSISVPGETVDLVTLSNGVSVKVTQKFTEAKTPVLPTLTGTYTLAQQTGNLPDGSKDYLGNTLSAKVEQGLWQGGSASAQYKLAINMFSTLGSSDGLYYRQDFRHNVELSLSHEFNSFLSLAGTYIFNSTISNFVDANKQSSSGSIALSASF